MNHLQKTLRLAAVFFLLCCTYVANAQALKNVFTDSESPILYLGIDFSESRLIDVGDAAAIRDKFYGSINQVVVDEPKKFDLKSAFKKSSMERDFGAVSKHNATANLNTIISTSSADFNRFKEADVNNIVKGLDLSGKTGVGLLFVMEAMKKEDKKAYASVWVTLVDMKTKKVLMTERVEARGGGGFGFRNYWASTIKGLIDTIDDKKYKEWQAKYGG